MQLTFLGTGTSQGVPIIGCKCSVCQSADPRDQRLRTSVHIQSDGLSFVIDSGPDFRQQMLHEKIDALDAILFTHDHKDHTAGLDDVRAYNHLMQKPMQVYGEEYVLSTIKREFSYAFTEKKYPGVPEIELNTIDDRPFFIENLKIIPIRGVHFKLPVLGFRIGNLAYLTDMNQLPESERYKLKDLDVLIINALRIKTHVSHFNLEQALDIIKLSQPKQAYLTHISHKLGLYQDLIQQLPSKVLPAYDGLKITF